MQLLLEESVHEKLIASVFKLEAGKPHILTTTTSLKYFYLQAPTGPRCLPGQKVFTASNRTSKNHHRKLQPGMKSAMESCQQEECCTILKLNSKRSLLKITQASPHKSNLKHVFIWPSKERLKLGNVLPHICSSLG